MTQAWFEVQFYDEASRAWSQNVDQTATLGEALREAKRLNAEGFSARVLASIVITTDRQED